MSGKCRRTKGCQRVNGCNGSRRRFTSGGREPRSRPVVATRDDPAARERLGLQAARIRLTSVDKRDNANDDRHLDKFWEALTG